MRNLRAFGESVGAQAPARIRPRRRDHLVAQEGRRVQGRYAAAQSARPLRYIWGSRRSALGANAVVRARTDAQTKAEAAAVLKVMGLTVSDAFRLTMVRIAKEKALPFEPLAPNEETIEAMKAARRGELVTIAPPGNLLASLDAGG